MGRNNKFPQLPVSIKKFYVRAALFIYSTSFNIREVPQAKQVEVVVLTGKVALTGNRQETTDGQTLIIEAMQKATAGSGGIFKENAQALSVYMQGTAYDMRFDEAPLGEVFGRIEQKFDVKIIYPAVAGNCRMTADFTDQALETTLQMMTSTLGEVSCQVKDKTVYLEGKACQ